MGDCPGEPFHNADGEQRQGIQSPLRPVKPGSESTDPKKVSKISIYSKDRSLTVRYRDLGLTCQANSIKPGNVNGFLKMI